MTPEASVTACCRVLYGNPLVELLLGESLHPGGLDGTRRLLAAGSLAPGARLLDAGCGSGASARLAAGETGLVVEGIDVSEAAIQHAQERTARGAVRFCTADLTRLPYEAASFDAVLAECVLSTVPKRTALLELRRVLRPDGRLLLSDVRAEGDGPPIDEIPPDLVAALCLGGAWRPDEVDPLLAEAGFRVERRWDDRRLLETFVERVVARLDLLRLAGRDLAIDPSALISATHAGIGIAHDQVDWGAALADIRRSLARGAFGYFSLVARAACG